MHLFIITGTSKGIGLGLQRTLTSQGHWVVGVSRSKTSGPSNYMPIQFDLSKSHIVEKQLKQKILVRLKKVKIKSLEGIHLINNAAQLEPVKPVQNLTFKEVNPALQLNVVTPILLTKIFLEIFKNVSCPKTITNLSSGVAFSPLENWGIYSLTKAALKHYSHSLRLELPSDVKVLSFGPGIVDTPMQAQIRKKSKKQFALVDKFIDYHDSKQLHEPDVVAKYLAKILLNPNSIETVEIRMEAKT